MTEQKKIIIGVSGGVAAYKTAMLVSRLVQSDWQVQVVSTSSAQRFVGDATFSALTGRPVASKLFDERFPLGAHIELARDYDVICIAPATANVIGKVASGLADDLLSTLCLCFMGPIIMAPAMNCEMWDKAPVQRNLQTVQKDGIKIVEPGEGWLSCRVKGKGRMAEPDEIYDALLTATELD